MKKKAEKEAKVKDAEITNDGGIVIEFNKKIYPHTTKAIFDPEALFALAEECGDIPPSDFNDFPGVPVVTLEGVYEEDSHVEDNGVAEEEKDHGKKKKAGSDR